MPDEKSFRLIKQLTYIYILERYLLESKNITKIIVLFSLSHSFSFNFSKLNFYKLKNYSKVFLTLLIETEKINNYLNLHFIRLPKVKFLIGLLEFSTSWDLTIICENTQTMFHTVKQNNCTREKRELGCCSDFNEINSVINSS